MSFRIQNNIPALNSWNHMSKNSSEMNKSLSRLSSGYRINSAADDAAGLSSSMRLRAEVSSLKVASRNAAEATSLLQVAEGAMSQIDLILNRMKELATQAASGNSGSDLSKLNSEATALTNEINRITGFTEYNDKVLLEGNFGSVSLSSTAPAGFVSANGVENIDVSSAKAGTGYTLTALSLTARTLTLSDGSVSQTVTYSNALGVNEDEELNFSALGVKITVNNRFAAAGAAALVVNTSKVSTSDTLGDALFQIGSKDSANHRLGFKLSDVSTTSLSNGSALTVDLSSIAGAQAALGDIDAAISYLASKRADVGTLVNRLGYAQSNLSTSIENKSASESTIRDVDMASEMSNFTKNQILVQASTAMLAQANAAPQAVLSLLR